MNLSSSCDAMAQDDTTNISISVHKSKQTGLWDAAIVVHGFEDRAEALMATKAIQELLARSLGPLWWAFRLRSSRWHL